MYPIKFENLYYHKIWGGQELKKFRKNLPEGDIGESWDIACHPNGIGIVSNGIDKGLTFEQLIEKHGQNLIGKKINEEKFPLLIKIITAKDKLSIQVHPDDYYAKKFENELGKTEAWYILDAEEDSYLILGTKNCDREKFREALKNNDLEKYLNKVKVKKGDFFYVQSGLIHGICEGVTILEVQQSSDTTYRVYDYNRERELHIDKALDVIKFSLCAENIKGIEKKYDKVNITKICEGEFFNIEKYEIFSRIIETSDENKFFLFTCVCGNGKVISGKTELDVNYGDSFMIPAALGEYELDGNFTLLKSYVPV